VDLLPDETLVWQGRPSWRSTMSFYARWIVIAIVPLVLGGVLGQLLWGTTGAVVIIAIALIVGWLRRLATRYTITDRRIVINRGILSRHEQRAHIDRVQNVQLTQSMFDRLFGVGTLDFDTAGTDDSDFRFIGIADPEQLRDRIDREYVARTREMGRPEPV
jgi:uncharacterized membrane protein YdbT with pleckstrin-like domain